MDLLKRENNAINKNGNYRNGALADIAITTHGSDFYFAICAAMTVSAIAFVGLSFTKPRRDRAFYYITAAVVWVAAIAYFTMGSNLGFTPILVEFRRNDPVVRGVYRSIFYVRYIDWFITTPLLLTDLLLTAGLPWQQILWVILVDEIMVVTGLIGALTESSYKWGYYVFGCVALFYILYVLVWEARRHAIPLGNDVSRAYLYCGALTAFLWTLYPIAWGVSEGGNVISPDSEAVFYGILDFLAKPCFGALLIWGHRNIEPARLGMDIKDYDSDLRQSRMRGEKHHGDGIATGVGHHSGPPEHTNGTNGHTNGHTNGVDTATATGANPAATNTNGSTANPHATV